MNSNGNGISINGSGGRESQNNSPDHSPPNYASTIPNQYSAGGTSHEFDEMHVLANAASQQLEQEKARSNYLNNSYSVPQRHPTFSANTTYHSNHHYTVSPYNRPSLTMSRQHSQEDEDHIYGHESHRSKRSRPGSPVFSTAPNSPLMSHKRSPTPDHTPLVTPAHSPRLHPRELDALHGIHLPSIRQLSLRGAPPFLAPLEVDPFQPGSGYSSPQNPRHQAPVNAMKLSDILESTSTDHDGRTLPLPRLSINDLISQSPGTGSSSASGNLSGHTSGYRSNSNSAPHSRSNSHSNLKELR